MGAKILLVFVSISAVSIGALALVASTLASASLREAASNKLESQDQIKGNQNHELIDSALVDDDADLGLTRTYEETWDGITKYFHIYVDKAGYDDIFLICFPHGHVSYSYARQSDLGEDLSVGPLGDTGPGRGWSLARDARKPVVVDMAPYAPHGNEPSMFVADVVCREADRRPGQSLSSSH